MKLLLKPQRFVCERRSGEVGHDEIYWAMSAGADSGEKKSFKTPEFGSVQTGSDRAFTGGHAGILIDGWVRGHVSLNIECWEADDSSGGFYNKMREVLNTLAERLADGAKSQTYEPPEHGGANPEGWAALLSVVAQLVNALLGWLTNDDDLVCERTIGLDRAALDRYFTASGYAANWLFNGGGGGSHRLWLHGTLTPYEVKPRYRELSSAGSQWGTPGYLADRRGMSLPAVGVSWANNFTRPGILYTDAAADQLFWADNTNDMGGPIHGAHTIVPAAGVEFNGKVHCVFTGRDGRVYWTVRTGTTWSAPAGTTWGSRHSPALAVHDNKLYCAHTGVGGDLWLATFTGSSWGTPTQLGSWRTTSGPALATHGSPAKLQCAHRGATDTIWVASLNGTTWADPTEISPSTVKTNETPALASFDGQLHVAYRGHNHNLFVIPPFGSSSRPIEIQSDGYGSPSLAVHGGKLYAFRA
ncbi:hypothetical protein OHB49_42615 (plasmid) [Streptomyces sp. NBC_01717]|uniref:hypothetical protein n=1 Tax=Streptomyces sp. NBC_01717 TaxID=2975918 RepID=UPI002E37F3EC|nr:hypothetical protein [Streptomyces sp. NBC_01717]